MCVSVKHNVLQATNKIGVIVTPKASDSFHCACLTYFVFPQNIDVTQSSVCIMNLEHRNKVSVPSH